MKLIYCKEISFIFIFLRLFCFFSRERVEQKQRDKIEARLTEVRSRTPTNIIHVQTCDDDDNSQLNDEQKSATQNSIQLLNENNGYKHLRSTTPVYGDEDSNEKIANIYI